MLRTTVAAAIAAATLAAPAAAADIPFHDGPGSARKLQTALNHDPGWHNVTCRYTAPLVRCRGYSQWARSDAYLRTTVTVHKTSVRRGYSLTCVTSMGVCKREAIRFTG